MARLALTMPAPFIAFCAPSAGALVDRVGPGEVLGRSIVLYVLGGASGGLASSLPTILVDRAVLGVGVARLMTATTALIGALFDENRRAAVLGYQAAAMAVAAFFFGRIKRFVSPAVALAVMFAPLDGGLALAGLAERFPTIALAITGVGAGLILPVADRLLLAAADRHAHGRAAGTLSTSVYLGEFVSPVAFALVAGGGIAAGFVWAGVAGGVLALGATVAILGARRNESTPSV